MSDWQEDQFDALLRQALTARPEVDAPVDLASRAIARATPSVLKPRTTIWRTLSSLAACLLIATVLSAGAWRWYQSGSATDTARTETSDSSAVSSAYTISSQNATLFLLGGGVFILALGLLTLDRLLVADDSSAPGSLIY